MSLHDRLYNMATKVAADTATKSIKHTINQQIYKKNVTPWVNKDPHEGFYFYMFVCVFVLFLLWIIKKSFSKTFAETSFERDFYVKNRNFKTNQIPEAGTEDRDKSESKQEYHVRLITQKVFNKPFMKIRPDFLKNNVTEKNLEIDLYNEELKLAIEVQGQQHYKYIPFFHKNYEAFRNQQYRDEVKKLLLEKNQIKLIEVPYHLPLASTEHFLRIKALELGYQL